MPEGRHAALLLPAAFATVYVVWGSTYLAIRIAIETMPPLLMAGTRFLLAGALLYAALGRRWPRPTRQHWVAATVIGGLMLLGGNGAVTWAEQWVPSGLAALLVATMPLWFVLHGWSWGGDGRPGLATTLGILVGLAGVALLVGFDPALGGRSEVIGALVILLGAFSWAAGSLLSRGAALPRAPLQAVALEMLAGGALLTLAGLALGEGAALDPGAFSLRSLAAWAYLVVFGSIVAFSAYIWLLKATTPAKVSTYAYVNPVVAVFLGWAVLAEPITARTLVAAAIILGSVMLITTRRTARPGAAKEPSASTEEGETWTPTTSGST